MDEIKNNVAKNIAAYRKQLNLTQLQLAEKLNYSDKAVSKWERGEAVPDIYILHELALLFKISVDELIGMPPPTRKIETNRKRNKAVISLLSTGLVWLVATVAFVILDWCGLSGKLWLTFIYALPASAIVGIVFNSMWGKRTINIVLISMLIWTLTLSIFLSFNQADVWLIFLVAIPLQVLTIIWAFLKKK